MSTAYGVEPERTPDPVNPPSIDRQRVYKAQGGNIGMMATRTPGKTLNKGRASDFKNRRKRF